MQISGTGKSVKKTAAEVGYNGAFFLSRMFRPHLGASRSACRLRGASGSPVAE